MPLKALCDYQAHLQGEQCFLYNAWNSPGFETAIQCAAIIANTLSAPQPAHFRATCSLQQQAIGQRAGQCCADMLLH